MSVSSPIILFADDTSIVLKGKTAPELQHNILESLTNTKDWFTANKLTNKSKQI